jgi:hypothetical protein
MDRIISKLADSTAEKAEMQDWLRTTLDGDLFDHDVLAHASTFIVNARSNKERLAYLPIQQPLMLENLIFRPMMSATDKARVIAKLAEFAVSEAYRRDAGELYFLCRDQSTVEFAERHLFKPLPEGLTVRRLNLLETFG